MQQATVHTQGDPWVLGRDQALRQGTYKDGLLCGVWKLRTVVCRGITRTLAIRGPKEKLVIWPQRYHRLLDPLTTIPYFTYHSPIPLRLIS